MVEMKKQDKINKLANRYVHQIKITYPIENVTNMINAWETKIKEEQAFIDGYDEQITNLVGAGCAELDGENEKIRKELETLKNLTEEELMIRLKDAHKAFIEQQEKYLLDIDVRKEELKTQITNEMAGYRKKVGQDLIQLHDALKIWKEASEKKV